MLIYLCLDDQQRDLWEAKSLVLDLLGWGVPSSHLVDCGLHPRLIYAIFSDLHLQLPPNLDVAELQQRHSSFEQEQ
jgi:hypothetical protein